MTITAPPTIPQITDPSTFATRAQDWVVWQSNELYPAIVDASSVLGLSTTSTSSTSNTIGTGSKSFTVETGKGYTAGQSLSIAYTTTPTNRMFAVVTSYNSGTGDLVVNVQAVEGSGTYTAWSIALAFNGVVLTGQIQNAAVTTPKLALDIFNGFTAVTPAIDDLLPSIDTSDSSRNKKITLSDLLSVPHSILESITASVVANALTITINPSITQFRSATLNSGAISTVVNTSAISTVISSGSTGGTTNGVAARIAVLEINNAGTAEVAWCNTSGGVNLDEGTLISTTAEGGAGAADSASVIYSTTARSNVAFRIKGYIDIVQATAGTWASAPTKIQGAGGGAVSSWNSIGYNQTWTDVTASRAINTTYTNTTGKPILLLIQCTFTNSNGTLTLNGISIASKVGATGTVDGTHSVLVPNGNTYLVTTGFVKWLELR